MRRTIITALFTLALACDDTKPGPPPIAGCTDACTNDASSSSTDVADTLRDESCAAYDGCVAACSGDCRETCAIATDAVLEFCEDERCDALASQCAGGDATACGDLATCTPLGDGSSSTAAETSSTT